jgi:hypothetical protein
LEQARAAGAADGVAVGVLVRGDDEAVGGRVHRQHRHVDAPVEDGVADQVAGGPPVGAHAGAALEPAEVAPQIEAVLPVERHGDVATPRAAEHPAVVNAAVPRRVAAGALLSDV